MLNQVFNLLGSIIVLAMISVALSKNSNTQGVVGAAANFFTGSIKAARGN